MTEPDLAPALMVALKDVVGDNGWLTATEDVAPYARDWHGLFNGRTPMVLRPTSTARVSDIVRLCAEAGVGIVPQGGNTGCLGAEGSCHIGGNLSTNAGGTGVLRYGNTRDLALGLEVVLPDGRIWHGLRRLRKNNTGYDFRHLFIGAEGTLGIITAAVFKLFPQPEHTATAMVALPELAQAVTLLSHMRRYTGDLVTGFEYIHGSALAMVAEHVPECRVPLDGCEHAALVELAGGAPDDDLAELMENALAAAFEAGLAA